jgi:hypothetical protein
MMGKTNRPLAGFFCRWRISAAENGWLTAVGWH